MSFRNWCALGLCLLLANLSGCSLLYKLRPDQLRKWNRVPPPTLDPEFTQMASPSEGLLVDSGFESAPSVFRGQNPR